MELNKKQIAKRDEILNIKDEDYSFGLARFENVDHRQLGDIIDHRLTNPASHFNDAPSTNDFFDFLEKYPKCTCHGFVKKGFQAIMCIEGIMASW